MTIPVLTYLLSASNVQWSTQQQCFSLQEVKGCEQNISALQAEAIHAEQELKGLDANRNDAHNRLQDARREEEKLTREKGTLLQDKDRLEQKASPRCQLAIFCAALNPDQHSAKLAVICHVSSPFTHSTSVYAQVIPGAVRSSYEAVWCGC